MLPSQDMQYLAMAIDIETLSHLSKRSENILVENKSRLMDLRCKSDLNVSIGADYLTLPYKKPKASIRNG